MRSSWEFILTPQFLFGSVVVGLFLNITAHYIIRITDRVRIRLAARAAAKHSSSATRRTKAIEAINEQPSLASVALQKAILLRASATHRVAMVVLLLLALGALIFYSEPVAGLRAIHPIAAMLLGVGIASQALRAMHLARAADRIEALLEETQQVGALRLMQLGE